MTTLAYFGLTLGLLLLSVFGFVSLAILPLRLFEHLRDTASSILKWGNVATAAAIRRVTVWGWWIPTGNIEAGCKPDTGEGGNRRC
jgi:hypothetical protein